MQDWKWRRLQECRTGTDCGSSSRSAAPARWRRQRASSESTRPRSRAAWRASRRRWAARRARSRRACADRGGRGRARRGGRDGDGCADRRAVAPYVRRGRKKLAQLAAVSYADGVKLPLRNVEDRTPSGRVALRTNSIATVLEAVRLGWGAGDLPCFVGDATPELDRAFPGEKPDWLDVWLIVHADVQRTARVRILVEELTRVFREGAALLAAGASTPALPARAGVVR